MPHRDVSSDSSLNLVQLQAALNSLLANCDFSAVNWKSQCTWTPRLLASVALLWAWSDESTLVERFENSRKVGLRLFAVNTGVAGSYQAFVKLLNRWTAPLLEAITLAFRQAIQTQFADQWLVEGWAMFGVDGSKIALPRTADLQASCAASRKPTTRSRRKPPSRSGHRKASNPQLLLTTLWHAGTGLVWGWRMGPSDDSERRHLLGMLEELPPQALVTADAGFVGYDFLNAVQASGRHFLVRVGANVRLLQQLGYAREYAHTVCLWPDNQARRQQSPLVLRLAVYHHGKQMMHVLTSLPKSAASDARLLRLYRRRWGIELYYRQLKETFGRHKLKSKSTLPARTELQWSLAGLWALSLHALPPLLAAGKEPRRLSCAQVLRIIRRLIRDWRHPLDAESTLESQLSRAVIDDYARRNKSSRGTPRKRTVQPPGLPSIQIASPAQQQAARRLKQNKSTQG